MAKLTLFSIYSYLNAHSDDLFESFSDLPEDIDKDILCQEILMRGGEFGVIYSDPNFMKACVAVWTKKWIHTIERWIKAQNEDYNPLHNYDRYEEYSDTISEEASGGGTSTGNDSSTNTENKNTYDSDTLNPVASATNTSGSSLTSTSSSSSDKTVEHSAHLYGNIGVTTSAQMLSESRSVERWSLYENIAGLFISEFCIPIYE